MPKARSAWPIRRGYDWADRYPLIAKAMAALPRDATIDDEAACWDGTDPCGGGRGGRGVDQLVGYGSISSVHFAPAFGDFLLGYPNDSYVPAVVTRYGQDRPIPISDGSVTWLVAGN
jgi:hypothetical protein